MEDNIFFQFLIILTGIIILGWLAFGDRSKNQKSQTQKFHKWDGMAEIVTYNGHEYIRFDGGYATWGCHNPDCKCMKKEEERHARNQD